MRIDDFNKHLRRFPTWPVYLLGFGWAVWLFWLGFSGKLGPEPVQALEHRYGELALQLLILGLAVTPLRRFLGLNLLKFRRAFGLLAFFYVTVHLTVWFALDLSLRWDAILADIVKRPYITVGMVAFAGLIPLAATSTNRAIRKLGPRWRQLHKLVYPIAGLAGIHYIMVQKVWETEPLIYLVVVLCLIGLRFLPRQKASGVIANG